MLLANLREEVMKANQDLVREGVVKFTFGNVSGISREEGLVAIKPSGVPYDELTPATIVVTDLDGRVVDSNLRPSSDLPTHLELYKAFPNIGGRRPHAFGISPPRGRRRGDRFPASAPPMPTISTGRCR